MSTLHPMSGPPPMASYMESWVPLCVTACVSQSPYFVATPCLESVQASVLILLVHLSAYVWSTPYA